MTQYTPKFNQANATMADFIIVDTDTQQKEGGEGRYKNRKVNIPIMMPSSVTTPPTHTHTNTHTHKHTQ